MSLRECVLNVISPKKDKMKEYNKANTKRLKFQSKGRNLLALQGLLSNGEILPLLILSKKDLPKNGLYECKNSAKGLW